MNKNIRKILVLAHLLLAGFMAPVFILLAVSGGLYLLGNKGSVTTQDISLPANATLDFKSATLRDDVDVLLKEAGIDHKFEYVKNRGTMIELRPTSRTYISIKTTPIRTIATIF